MLRDDKIRMRDGLVIPGGLLVFYGVLAIIYAEAIRSRSDFCPDGTWILISGICYTAWKILLPFVLIGLALLITGLVAFRGEPESLEGHLHHGSGSHFTLALLISLVALPGIAWIVQVIRQNLYGGTFEMTVLGGRYEHTFLLELVILAGLFMLVPYTGLYIASIMHRRRFLAAAARALEEPVEPLPHEAGFQHPDADKTSGSEEMLDEQEWPQERHEEDQPKCEAHLKTGTCANAAEAGRRFCANHACSGARKDGQPCANQALLGEAYCRIHLPSPSEEE